jgi:hypothetical protein
VSDPEALYAELVSGDSGTLRHHAGTLDAVMTALDGAVETTTAATETPVWSSAAASSYRMRAAGIVRGIQANYAGVARTELALEGAARAYDSMVTGADTMIGFWRRRPPGANPIIEQVLRNVVNRGLFQIGQSYSDTLAGLAGATDGTLDLDEVDEETREWLENGRERTEDWLDDTSSDLGPLIPHTKATGDDRGLVPQGLAFDGENLAQVYYDEDEAEGDPSALSLINNATGQESSHVNLGGDVDGISHGSPKHSGGVAFDGDNVYVTSSDDPPMLYTYSKKEIDVAGVPADPSKPSTVQPTRPPQPLPSGASAYVTVHNGHLYVGDFTGAADEAGGEIPDGKMYQLAPDGNGGWDHENPVDTIDTPPKAQGVVIRDGEYVFATSEGRDNPSELVVQSKDGTREDPVALPNMAEGIAEVDGDIVATYESGAGKYSDTDGFGPDWGSFDDDEDLWASEHMTRTPLSELGLSEEVEVQPQTLRGAASDLDGVADQLRSQAGRTLGVHVSAHALGQVPAADEFAAMVNDMVERANRSLRNGQRAATAIADMLVDMARTYVEVDEHAAQNAARMTRGLEW